MVALQCYLVTLEHPSGLGIHQTAIINKARGYSVHLMALLLVFHLHGQVELCNKLYIRI